jgi:DNA repair exonuclease SbcCD ATPase subunit
MYIEFVSLQWKNLLSYGNNLNEISFNTGMTLITAQNGGGKSTIIDALSFCLFGQPYRDIKIPELINRRNKKKL